MANPPRLTVEVKGDLKRFNAAVRTSRRKLDPTIRNVHAGHIRQLTRRAQLYLYEDIRRPDETGQRSRRRETQKFTFGSGGAFRGKIFNEKGLGSGFGWPVLDVADSKTNGIWRVLEFGIGKRGKTDGFGPLWRQLKQQFGPTKQPKFPTRFTFLPFTKGATTVLFPQARGSRTVGMLVTPHGRPLAPVQHPGQAGKGFISRAWEETSADLPQSYRTAVSEVFRDV